MSQPFTRRFRVRHYETDLFGHVHHVAFVQYMQEAAIDASSVLGCSPEWYRQRNTGWVVRRLWVRYLDSLTHGDEVAVVTWLSGIRGVRSNREYDLVRVRDGVRVARARAEWVYMDATTGQPTRVPDGWAEAFPLTDKGEDLGVRLGGGRQTNNPYRYTCHRRVQFHELDGARHVNHAVYLRWTEEAYFAAIGACGQSLEQTRQQGWMARLAGHEVQYFAAALDNDPIEVISWISDIAEDRVVWTHEVYHAETRKLLARDYSLLTFVTPNGDKTSPPVDALEKLEAHRAGATHPA